MKQKDIKEGRYYQSRRNKTVRFVSALDEGDGSVVEDGMPAVFWKPVGDERVLFAEKEISLKEFARWAGQEVVPGFIPVKSDANKSEA